MASKKNKLPKLPIDVNQIEAIRDSGSSIVKTVNEEIKRDAHLAWEMALGLGKFEAKRGGEMQQGEEIILAKKQEELEEKAKLRDVEGGFNYKAEILYAERRVVQETNREIKLTVREILTELAKIKSLSKEVELQFRSVDTIKVPENPGKYHLNFFEWVLSVVRNARVRIKSR